VKLGSAGRAVRRPRRSARQRGAPGGTRADIGRACALAVALLLSGGAGAALEVIDFAGRRVSLEQPARRIVALAPHTVENAFSAGAGDALVGAVSYSDYPPAARDIPRVGDYQAWSLESIVARRPDLVLMWGSASAASDLPALERLGIPVFVSEPRRLSDIPRALRAIGTLAGTSEIAEREARTFEQELARLHREYGRSQPLAVFYEIWNRPLQTLNGEHFISDVISLCGGRNVFADAAPLAPLVNVEAVLQSDPEVILASGMDAARPEWLDSWRAFPHLRAVRAQALFFIHPDLLQRPTTRLLEGARQLCERLDSLPR
jgi:iron complex transport system substrate-binding protein